MTNIVIERKILKDVKVADYKSCPELSFDDKSLDAVIATLVGARVKYSNLQYFNLRLVQTGQYNSKFILRGDRYETDAELDARRNRALDNPNPNRKRKDLKAETEIQKELAELARLKAKYETD